MTIQQLHLKSGLWNVNDTRKMVIELTEKPPQYILIIITIKALFVKRIKKFHIVYLHSVDIIISFMTESWHYKNYLQKRAMTSYILGWLSVGSVRPQASFELGWVSQVPRNYHWPSGHVSCWIIKEKDSSTEQRGKHGDW